jgi:hypothetical protein
MWWAPFVNCPWSESSNQLGLSEYRGVYSAHQMRTTAYAGLVGNAGIPNLLFFDYFTETEDRLLHGVGDVAQEMQDLKASLLAPVTQTQPSVSVSNNVLRARAWAEAVAGSTSSDVCVHVIVLNSANSFQHVSAVIDYHNLPHATTAMLPFEGDADRQVPVTDGVLSDSIAPNAVNVYRIGCSVAPPAKENLSPNPSFELPSLLGGVSGWSGGRAGWWASDGHDTRARLFLDTTRPQHGRYALRFTVPSGRPLVQPWSQQCTPECNADSPGTRLTKGTKSSSQNSLWARSSVSMHLKIMIGSWQLDKTEYAAFHTAGTYVCNQTLATLATNTTWLRVSATVGPSTQDRYVQLQFDGGPGMMFIDNTSIVEFNSTY